MFIYSELFSLGGGGGGGGRGWGPPWDTCPPFPLRVSAQSLSSPTSSKILVKETASRKIKAQLLKW
jgi:hypothetical protein